MNVHTQKSRQTDRQTDKLSDTVNLPPKRVSNADVSSLSPSSEWMANAQNFSFGKYLGRPI